MNMKLKKSDVNILIMLLGILIPVGVYFFVYNSYTEKTAAMNASNEVLQSEVDYLQDLADHKQQYIDDTAAMQIQIEEIKTHFPVEYKPEDDILYIITLNLNKSELDYYSVFSKLCEKYGEPDSLSPEKSQWDNGSVIFSLEKNLRRPRC